MRNNNQSFLPKLIFLCVITTSIVATLSLSKYQSTVAGSKSARVSIPILNVKLAENQEESLTIDCNEEDTSLDYKIVVSNTDSNVTSEVSLKYDIIITLPTEISSGFSIKVDDREAIKNINTYTIENVGQFSPSVSNENTHTLTFEADPDIVRNGIFENITITVYAEQID